MRHSDRGSLRIDALDCQECGRGFQWHKQDRFSHMDSAREPVNRAMVALLEALCGIVVHGRYCRFFGQNVSRVFLLQPMLN